jgi:peptide/nickel transport system permease protein
VNRLRVGAVLISLLAITALAAPAIAPYDPVDQPDPVNLRNAPPSLAHPLGTDQYSRDLLSRVVYGSRISLAIALAAVVIAMTVGTGVGLAAGYLGGPIDSLLMRLVDAGLAIPRVFLLLVVLVLWEGVSVGTWIAVLGLTGWFGVSRIVRAEVQSARGRDYVSAARAIGAGPVRIIGRHILPNVAGPVIGAATLGIGHVILIEASLSYLGVGVPQPTPSWGNLINDGRHVMTAAPWIATAGGAAIVITVLAFSVLGEGLREALDPRHR